MVLFNIGTVYHKLGQLKSDFWSRTHIGIPDPDTESNDAVVLGFLVAQFIGEVKSQYDCLLYKSQLNNGLLSGDCSFRVLNEY